MSIFNSISNTEKLEKKVNDISNNEQFTDEECFAMSIAKPRGERKFMCFDWATADAIISDLKPKYAIAYLKNDMGNTCGVIYKDGHRVISDDHPYLGSIWAIPMLQLSFENEGETYKDKSVPCFYTYDDQKFDPTEMWPDRFDYIIKECKDERH